MARTNVRMRLHAATLSVAASSGFRFSVEDVATQAGVSRATVYRHFPGGRDQLIEEAVNLEVATFFTRVEAVVATEPDLEAKLVAGLQVGRRLLTEHDLLHAILREDPEALLIRLEGALERVFEAMEAYIASLLGHAELAAGVDRGESAEYLARLCLSYLGHGGRWDLDDADQARELVRTQFLAGILA